MKPPRRRFVAVYYDLAREFPAIWADNTLLATWLRLLVIADSLWPLRAPVPRSTNQDALDSLVKAGLIEIAGDEFTVKGLDKGRQQRVEHAQMMAEARWGKKDAASSSDSNAESSSHAAHSSNASNGVEWSGDIEEPPTPRPTLVPVGDKDSLDTYYELTMYRPWGQWSGDAIKGLIAEYGDAVVDAAMRAEAALDGKRDTLLKRLQARLARDADRAAEQKRKAPPPAKRKGDLYDDPEYQRLRREAAEGKF